MNLGTATLVTLLLAGGFVAGRATGDAPTHPPPAALPGPGADVPARAARPTLSAAEPGGDRGGLEDVLRRFSRIEDGLADLRAAVVLRVADGVPENEGRVREVVRAVFLPVVEEAVANRELDGLRACLEVDLEERIAEAEATAETSRRRWPEGAAEAERQADLYRRALRAVRQANDHEALVEALTRADVHRVDAVRIVYGEEPWK